MTLPIKIQRQDKDELVSEIQDYVAREFGEPIGNIAAEGLLDYVLSLVLPHIYNQAIQDAKNLVSTEFARLDEEMSVLLRPVARRR